MEPLFKFLLLFLDFLEKFFGFYFYLDLDLPCYVIVETINNVTSFLSHTHFNYITPKHSEGTLSSLMPI